MSRSIKSKSYRKNKMQKDLAKKYAVDCKEFKNSLKHLSKLFNDVSNRDDFIWIEDLNNGATWPATIVKCMDDTRGINMKTEDYLLMKAGALIKTTSYIGKTGNCERYCLGTIVSIHAPRFISVMMHGGLYKDKIINLRGYDLVAAELLHVKNKCK